MPPRVLHRELGLADTAESAQGGDRYRRPVTASARCRIKRLLDRAQQLRAPSEGSEAPCNVPHGRHTCDPGGRWPPGYFDAPQFRRLRLHHAASRRLVSGSQDNLVLDVGPDELIELLITLADLNALTTCHRHPIVRGTAAARACHAFLAHARPT